ncbi:hypothetical protein TRV_02072 [Trichophyton verrucosum HKI 0517]|uniref:Uncharacterized protein n=1 Tax=Trichophyton verrucosum (strain HKI 0517) TaxID=663202 RepID=D4D4Q6_TRIVH|nr:uncharacterized protein TRV_02072 [Trichophyton verrucosum HKI 0517]EFE43165.1 hypothetical protein TRV_02072 [Trichophyton verrucosum HKI 0517]
MAEQNVESRMAELISSMAQGRGDIVIQGKVRPSNSLMFVCIEALMKLSAYAYLDEQKDHHRTLPRIQVATIALLYYLSTQERERERDEVEVEVEEKEEKVEVEMLISSLGKGRKDD